MGFPSLIPSEVDAEAASTLIIILSGSCAFHSCLQLILKSFSGNSAIYDVFHSELAVNEIELTFSLVISTVSRQENYHMT